MSVDAGGRSDIDDRAAAAVANDGRRRADAEERPGEIDRQHAVPIGARCAGEIDAAQRNAGIVDQHMQTAERTVGERHGVRPILFAADVEMAVVGCAASGANGLHEGAGFTQYIRHLCIDADARLIAAYVDAGLARKVKMSLAELLKDKIVQNVLRVCARPLLEQPVPEALVRQVCGSLNNYRPLSDGADETPAGKLADDQLRNFLDLLARQVATLVPPEPAVHEAELYSLADRKKKSATLI